VASTINVAAYSDALVVLGTAGIVVPIVSRLGFSPVLGYLGAGALLGPLGLGSLIGSVPALFWFTVGDAKDVAGIAELGVVFLLFLIGLELSLQRLLTKGDWCSAWAACRCSSLPRSLPASPLMSAARLPRRSFSAPACRCPRPPSFWSCCRTRGV